MPYKVRTGEKIPLHLERTVQGICGDFKRRATEIELNRKAQEVIDNYITINSIIAESLDEVCIGESDRVKLLMLEAIGDKRGHAWSPLCMMMSPNAFYERKYRIIRAIIVKMKLL